MCKKWKWKGNFPKSQLTSHLTKWKVIERVTAIKETISCAIKSDDWDGNYAGWSAEINSSGLGDRPDPSEPLCSQLIKRELTEWVLITSQSNESQPTGAILKLSLQSALSGFS